MKFTISIFICIFISFSALACECPQSERETVEKEFESSNSVFLGKVIDSKIDKGRSGFLDRFVSFQILKIYKGIKADLKTMTIMSSAPGNSCEIGFSFGKEYLFYGQLKPSGELSYDFCGRTASRENATEDIKYLDARLSK